MAHLDQLIGAMLQHNAESLILSDGERPALVLGGSPRPVVRTALQAAQVTRLVEEIAPADQRNAVAAGLEVSFGYSYEGRDVQVEVAAGPRVVIRAAGGPDPIPLSPATPGASPAAFVPAGAAVPVSEFLAETPLIAPPEPEPSPAVAPAAPRVEPGQMTMDVLFRTLVERDGSDLHVSSGCKPMIRVHGSMGLLEDMPVLEGEAAQKLLLSIAPGRNREEFEKGGDTDFAYEIAGLCRFRCNLFKDRKGPGGVFRVIPSKILTVDDLKLSEPIQDLCHLTKGLVLVTGPTGSGKSTTLAAMIDLVNRTRSDHIITIEDPIEFVHPNLKCLVNQREVHLHTKGFKAALRAALREDPDVVLVGELRDLETVAIAIETAETGHLVFGTLHTSSAVSTVDRIIDQFPADQQEQIRIMLSESLKGVIAQVLCKKIGGGRCAALEVLIVNAAVSNLIREGKTFQIPSIMQTGKKQGNVLLNNALLDLVTKKLVDPQEAYLKAVDKGSLVSAFQKKNIPTDFVREELTRPAQPA
jgi:twitching motility protein PilT